MDKGIDIADLNEINCFIDIFSVNDSYKKFVKDVKNFIQDIFYLLNVYLKKYDYLEDFIILLYNGNYF